MDWENTGKFVNRKTPNIEWENNSGFRLRFSRENQSIDSRETYQPTSNNGIIIPSNGIIMMVLTLLLEPTVELWFTGGLVGKPINQLVSWDGIGDGIGVFFPDFTMKQGGFWTWYDMIENSFVFEASKTRISPQQIHVLIAGWFDQPCLGDFLGDCRAVSWEITKYEPVVCLFLTNTFKTLNASSLVLMLQKPNLRNPEQSTATWLTKLI